MMELRLARLPELVDWEDKINGAPQGFTYAQTARPRYIPQMVRMADHAREFGWAAYDRTIERWYRGKCGQNAVTAALRRCLRLDEHHRAVWQAWQITKGMELQ
jgi:hypothetical protein